MLTALITFAAAGALVVVLPGPDTLVALRSLALRGRRGGVATGAGILTGLTVWALAAALGISAILRASHWGWLGLRIAGAVYLVVMGVRALQSSRRTRQGAPEAPPARRGGLLGTGYRAGLATDLLNPKVGVFFITFLPAFIPRGDDPAWPSLALGAIFVLETALYLAVLVVLAGRIRRWLDHPAIRRRLDRITGTVLIGFGVRLVVER